MSGIFYDGLRMRTRYRGERKRYSGIDVLASFIVGALVLAGTIILDVLRSPPPDDDSLERKPASAAFAATAGMKS